MDEKFEFNLSTLDADAILDQFPDKNWCYKTRRYNLFPNLPIVALMVKHWKVQSNRFWIVTNNIPVSVFKNLLRKNLVPIKGYGFTYPLLENRYYKCRCYA